MFGHQHPLNNAINEGTLMGSDPDPGLVHTVEEATERPASGVGFVDGSSRAGFGSGAHAALNGLGKDGDKNRLIFAAGFEREDDVTLGAGGEDKIEERVLHRTPPGRIAL